MSNRKENETLTIKWIMQDKKIVKFEEKDDTYDIVGKCADYISSLKEGDVVTVGFIKDDVAFMQKSDSQPSSKKETPSVEKQKPSEEVKQEETLEENVYVVGGIPADKVVINFVGVNDPKWFQTSDEVRALNFEALGIVRGAKVRIMIGEVDVKGKTKKCVESIEVVQEVSPSTENSSPSVGTGDDYRLNESNKSNSIENQVAVKSATEIIVALIGQGNEEVNSVKKIKKLITELSHVIKDNIKK